MSKNYETILIETHGRVGLIREQQHGEIERNLEHLDLSFHAPLLSPVMVLRFT